jgi:hypothetical protein
MEIAGFHLGHFAGTTSMNLMQRYIAAIQRHLPGDSRNDIGAEIRSSLTDSLDALEEANGRPLTDADIAGVLKRRGHPMKVAAEYNSTQALISSRTFPIYLRVLTAAFVLLGSASLALALFGKPGVPVLRSFVGWLHEMYWLGLLAFTWITLIFFLVDSWISRGNFFQRWDPQRLPPLRREEMPVAPAAAIADIALSALFLIVIQGGIWIGGRLLHVDAPLNLRIADGWTPVSMLVSGALLLLVAIGVAGLLQRFWNRATALLHALGHAVVAVGMLLFALMPGSLQLLADAVAVPQPHLDSLLYTARFLLLLVGLRSLYLAVRGARHLGRLSFADERPAIQ